MDILYCLYNEIINELFLQFLNFRNTLFSDFTFDFISVGTCSFCCVDESSSHRELFCKKCLLRCVFAWEFDFFWIVQHQLRKSCSLESGGTPAKLGVLLNIFHFVSDVMDFNQEDKLRAPLQN